jgi:hypothetical protein
MWKVAQPHDLREQLKAARNHRLGGHKGCEDSDHERWDEPSRRDSVIERISISGSGGITADEGSLSDICQKETGVGKAKPGELNSPDKRRELVSRVQGINAMIYLLLKAPRSANKASTPVNASRMPPRDFHPAVPFRTK